MLYAARLRVNTSEWEVDRQNYKQLISLLENQTSPSQ